MKTPIAIASLVVLFMTSGLHAQTKTFPEGLKKLETKDLMGMGKIDIDNLDAYDINGNLLKRKEAQKLRSSMKFGFDYYADDSGKVAAYRLRELTEREKNMMKMFQEAQARMAAMIGTEAKDFEALDMDGNNVKLSELKGKVVAINFWFVGCKPCIMEMPELNEMVEKYHGKEVEFIALALDKKESIAKFSEKTRFDYDLFPGTKEIATLYEVSGYPTHCVLDQEGKIQLFKSGYGPTTVQEIDEKIADLLGG